MPAQALASDSRVPADAGGPALSAHAFQLLAELRANNTKEWFDAHREAVKAELQLPFERVLEAASDRLAGSVLALRGGRSTMFRMNRDVRFSRDKTPYNAHVSGVLTRSGTKAEDGGLVYLQLDEAGGFMAAGAYKLDPKDLGPLRDAIAADPDRFKAVLDGLEGAGLELSRDLALRSMPQGYAGHSGTWYAPYLKLQGFTVRRDLSREDWTGGAIVDRLAGFAQDAAGLIRFTQDA